MKCRKVKIGMFVTQSLIIINIAVDGIFQIIKYHMGSGWLQGNVVRYSMFS